MSAFGVRADIAQTLDALALPLCSNVGNAAFDHRQPLAIQALDLVRLCARWRKKLGLEARPVEAAILLSHVIRETLARLVIALAVLREGGHPQCAFVYALVYSAAPEFYSSDR